MLGLYVLHGSKTSGLTIGKYSVFGQIGLSFWFGIILNHVVRI